MLDKNVVFLGAGNMARALIAGLCREGLDPARIQVHAPHTERRDALAEEFGVQSLAATPRALPARALVIYAAKPQQVRDILPGWAEQLREAHALVVSVAAGIRINTLQGLLPGVELIRAMPNTPAQVGAGITCLYEDPALQEAQRAQCEALFRGTGKTLWLAKEELLEVATALAGSGPAYVLLFLEALEEAALNLGMPRQEARLLAMETLRGTGEWLAASGLAPALLRYQVTSPGGTTAAALAVWEEGLRPLAQRALAAAVQRSQELALGTERGDGS
ncbi:MAG: pyrroline-5-carboxylate reductase [Acidithiobacillus sp.]|nr:pyrroline-5-carboxylate reductase [Acidithiobacillus sp.]